MLRAPEVHQFIGSVCVWLCVCGVWGVGVRVRAQQCVRASVWEQCERRARGFFFWVV